MGTNRSNTEEIDVNSDVVDEVVCLSDDGNPTTPTQADGSETAAAMETRGTPKKGMTFDSMEALEKFYSSYGKACGFGVIRVGAKKDGNTNVKRWQYWHCECGRGTSTNQVVKEGIAGYLNKDGLWEIHKVELTHKNHVPTPSKSRFIPSYKDVHKFVLRVAKDLMDAGVKQSQIYHTLANQMNGFKNLPFLLKEMHNIVGKERSKEFDETDCRVMFEYFAKMKEANEDFFFSWRVDEANKLMDVVWVDARSRVAYMDFCDVVCFDATYITNHYELPFANFVGVNHHGQTILLGCALVRNKDTETYKWVMREWLECMGGVQPGGIITDQSVPMAKAIQQVLPDSRHRLCVWHIPSKVPRKLLAMKKVGEVHKKMKDVVYDSLSIEEFECRWIELIRSFNLEGNEWLNSLWEERSCWVPAYVKDTFWAGFMNAKTSLREFVQKYTRAIECRANAEKVATANDDRRKTRLNQPLWSRGTEVQLSETVTEYTLIERIQVADPIRHVTRGLKVTVDIEKLEFTCSCRMFEHKGILCRHCIRAMEMTNIATVPDKYVLNRWRKDVKRKHLDVKEKIFNLASTSNELCEHAVKNVETFFEELEQLRLRTGSENGLDDFVVSTQGSNDATQTDYHEQQNAWDGVENPPPGKRIGRPPSKTPYGFPQQKKSKGSSRSKGSTKGSVTKPAPQRTQLMEQCMNSFYNTLSQTSSLGVSKFPGALQFDVHRPPRPNFRWAINEQQQSQVHPQLNGFTEHVAGCYSNSTSCGHDYRGFQGSSTAISSAASSAFRPLHPGSFTNWWTYGIGGTSATGSSSPFAPPLSQFGSGSTTTHSVSTASNGQPTLLP
ncbi:Protein FAR-RED IMPAIRED RESPONSE 1 [Bienertia sinuspersici]